MQRQQEEAMKIAAGGIEANNLTESLAGQKLMRLKSHQSDASRNSGMTTPSHSAVTPDASPGEVVKPIICNRPTTSQGNFLRTGDQLRAPLSDVSTQQDQLEVMELEGSAYNLQMVS